MPQDLPEHTVKSYEEELRKLREMVARMGGLAERAVADATRALIERDTELAGHVVAGDSAIVT